MDGMDGTHRLRVLIANQRSDRLEYLEKESHPDTIVEAIERAGSETRMSALTVHE